VGSCPAKRCMSSARTAQDSPAQRGTADIRVGAVSLGVCRPSSCLSTCQSSNRTSLLAAQLLALGPLPVAHRSDGAVATREVGASRPPSQSAVSGAVQMSRLTLAHPASNATAGCMAPSRPGRPGLPRRSCRSCSRR
jgi:hypothetical protein